MTKDKILVQQCRYSIMYNGYIICILLIMVNKSSSPFCEFFQLTCNMFNTRLIIPYYEITIAEKYQIINIMFPDCKFQFFFLCKKR